MVSYRDISFEDIYMIKDIWECNRKYHYDISKSFKDLYLDINFEERMEGFSNIAKDKLKITIVEDERTLGYCISAIDHGFGETHTLHVIEEARGRKIGKKLMTDHIAWMKLNNCKDIKITVDYENENTIKFYRSLGFMPNTVEMRIK